MSGRPPSLLDPDGPGWLAWIPVGAAVYGLAGAALFLFPGWRGAPEPLFDPDDVIEVTAVVLPKSPTALPERAQRAPRPAAPERPTPPPEAPPEPPPQRVSDLAVPSEAEPDPAPPQADPRAQMDDLLAELEPDMDDLLQDLDADVGPTDRAASSPDGVEGAPASAVVGAGTADPELARYIAQLSALFLEHFRPLPALKGQGLRAVVLVQVDPGGKVTDVAVQTGSGNPAWDRAAQAAAEDVGTVPLPPEKWRDGRTRYRIVFEDTP